MFRQLSFHHNWSHWRLLADAPSTEISSVHGLRRSGKRPVSMGDVTYGPSGMSLIIPTTYGDSSAWTTKCHWLNRRFVSPFIYLQRTSRIAGPIIEIIGSTQCQDQPVKMPFQKQKCGIPWVPFDWGRGQTRVWQVEGCWKSFTTGKFSWSATISGTLQLLSHTCQEFCTIDSTAHRYDQKRLQLERQWIAQGCFTIFLRAAVILMLWTNHCISKTKPHVQPHHLCQSGFGRKTRRPRGHLPSLMRKEITMSSLTQVESCRSMNAIIPHFYLRCKLLFGGWIISTPTYEAGHSLCSLIINLWKSWVRCTPKL